MAKQRPPPPDDSEILNRLRRHLEVLRLTHVQDHLEAHLAWAAREPPAPSALLERVLGEEAALRSEKRVERRIQVSGLKERKTLEAFQWDFQPKLDKALVLEVANLEFVRRQEDLIITGKPGTGKSHILQAIALRACQQQFSVRYARCVDLLDDLYAGLADGSYLERLKKWCGAELLVIDDVGLGQVKKRDGEPTAAHMLFDLLDRRHTKAATAMTSNVKLGGWGSYLGDPTLAAAMLDRLVMRAIRIDIDGPSWRQHVATVNAKAHGSALPDDE